MSRAALLVLALLVVVLLVIGLLIARSANAGAVRQQSVRLTDCLAPEADDDPEGRPIAVHLTVSASYEVIARLASVERVLATVPCASLPAVVRIGGLYPASIVAGRVSIYPGSEIPAIAQAAK